MNTEKAALVADVKYTYVILFVYRELADIDDVMIKTSHTVIRIAKPVIAGVTVVQGGKWLRLEFGIKPLYPVRNCVIETETGVVREAPYDSLTRMCDLRLLKERLQSVKVLNSD